MKTDRVVRRLEQAMSFPIEATSVRKVLVILPRNLEMLDRASKFVQLLRQSYPNWRVELFDVDKLSKDELNPVSLPRPEILAKLKKAQYHFVLDLNDNFDQISSYIALMTEATYRLHFRGENSGYYNIVYQPKHVEGAQLHYDPLLDYLQKLFV